MFYSLGSSPDPGLHHIYMINTQYCESIQKLKVTLLFIQEEV